MGWGGVVRFGWVCAGGEGCGNRRPGDGGRRRDRGSRRGLSEATSNRAHEGFSLERRGSVAKRDAPNAPAGFSPGGRRSVGAAGTRTAVSLRFIVHIGPGNVTTSWTGKGSPRATGVDGATPSIRTHSQSTRRVCVRLVVDARARPRRGRLQREVEIGWRWGRGPRRDGRRSQKAGDGGGTGWSRRGLGEATYNGAKCGFWRRWVGY
jgi:hypothetical protein